MGIRIEPGAAASHRLRGETIEEIGLVTIGAQDPAIQVEGRVAGALDDRAVSSTPRPLASPVRFSVPEDVPVMAIQASLATPTIPPLATVSTSAPAEPISIRSVDVSVEVTAVALDTVTVPALPALVPM